MNSVMTTLIHYLPWKQQNYPKMLKNGNVIDGVIPTPDKNLSLASANEELQ